MYDYTKRNFVDRYVPVITAGIIIGLISWVGVSINDSNKTQAILTERLSNQNIMITERFSAQNAMITELKTDFKDYRNNSYTIADAIRDGQITHSRIDKLETRLYIVEGNNK